MSSLGHFQRWEVVQSELASHYIMYTSDLRTLEWVLRLMHQPLLSLLPLESWMITPVTAVTETKMSSYLA